MRQSCVVKNCSSQNKIFIKYFKFPKQVEAKKMWLQNLEREDLINEDTSEMRVCEHHFSKEMFTKSGRRLTRCAVPTSISNDLDLFWNFVVKANEILPENDDLPSPLTGRDDETTKVEVISQEVSANFGFFSEKELENMFLLEKKVCEMKNESTDRRRTSEGEGSRKRKISQTTDIVEDNELKKLLLSTNSCRNINFKNPDHQLENSVLSSPAKEVQTLKWLSENTPRKHKLKKKIDELRKQLREKTQEIEKMKRENENKENFIKKAFEILPVDLARLVQCHIINAERERKGLRYTDEMKQFALSLYFLSPQTYRYLCNVMSFPSEKTLQRYVKNWPSGLHDINFDSLTLKLQSLPTAAKKCIICMDEMSLKTHLHYDKQNGEIVGLQDDGNKRDLLPAKSVFVIMARGITTNYKHLLGYVLVHKTLPAIQIKNLLLECIKKLENRGFQPKGIVCDQGPNFSSLASHLGISSSNAAFKMNSSTVHFFFDAPHLIKSIRNNLAGKKEIRYNGDKRASWSDVEEFYKIDKERDFRLAPKLTEDHITTNNFRKMKVRLAVQVLSHTVASGINSHVAGGQQGEKAAETAYFLKKFDNLFDMFNSSNLIERKALKRPFRGSVQQMEFLEEMKQLITSIRIIDKKGNDVTSNVRCLKGWLISIQSLIEIFKDLKKEGLDFLMTRRLNQDPLENSFSTIRQHGGNNPNPTPFLFRCIFKKMQSMKFLETVRTGNCEPTIQFVLPPADRKQLPSINREGTTKMQLVHVDNTIKKMIEDFGEENALCYFAGWLDMKCRDNHKCKNKETVNEQHGNYTFIANKQYENARLRKPSETFVKYVENLEEILTECFDKMATEFDIENKLHDKLKDVTPPICCEDFNGEYLLRLFIRVRIYYILKFYNRDVKEYNNRNKLLRIKHL